MRGPIDKRLDGLTDNEGSVLGLVSRRQPISTYQLMRIFEESPVSGLNDTKGVIYPVVRRLKQREMLIGRPVPNDGRGTELLECTGAGMEALRHWLLSVRHADVLPQDPLRTKMVFFDLLSRDEQQRWLQKVRDITAEKLFEVDAFGASLRIPFQKLLIDNMKAALRARKRWVEHISDIVERERKNPH